MSQGKRRARKAGATAVFALLLLWCGVLYLTWTPEREAIQTMGPDPRATLIVDPGHGGMDGGASTADGVLESRLNWQIALRLRDLCRLMGQKVCLTRESEEIVYPAEFTTVAERKRWETRDRVERINATPQATLISIHQNYYPAAKPAGAQVLYASDDRSRCLAEQLQATLCQHLTPENRRTAEPAGRDIYIMNHVQCPAVLVECGFLSNPREAALLQKDDYQIRICTLMFSSFWNTAEEKQ